MSASQPGQHAQRSYGTVQYAQYVQIIRCVQYVQIVRYVHYVQYVRTTKFTKCTKHIQTNCRFYLNSNLGKNKCVIKQTQTKSAANLFSRKQGLGVPIHIQLPSISIYIHYYTLLVLGGSIILPLLLIPSWALAIDPFLVSCAMSSAMLLPRRRKPLDGCFHPQGRASEEGINSKGNMLDR